LRSGSADGKLCDGDAGWACASRVTRTSEGGGRRGLVDVADLVGGVVALLGAAAALPTVAAACGLVPFALPGIWGTLDAAATPTSLTLTLATLYRLLLLASLAYRLRAAYILATVTVVYNVM
jgi:hypothetical protein